MIVQDLDLNNIASARGWDVAPMWSIARRVDRKGYPDAELLSVYRDYGVIRKSDRDDNHNVESEDLSTYKYVKVGDLVLNKMKTWQGSLGVSAYDGIVSPAYFTCELSPSVYGPYIHYLLRSMPYIAMYGALSKGIRVGQWDLPYEEFRDIPVLLPPLDEQRRIADYLDSQLAVVNSLIQNKRDQIVIAREISITNLFLDLKCNNSAGPTCQLPWLDFRVDRKIQFGRVFEISLGKMLQTEPKSEEDLSLPYLNSASVNDFLSNPDKRMWVNPKEFKNCQVLAGDLIVIEGGDVGRSKFYDGEPTIIQNSLHRVRSFSGNSLNYALAILNAVRHSGYFDIVCNVATIRHLTLEKLSELPIPFYEPDVQEKIGKAHQKNSDELSEKLTLLSESITKLGEYKTSLITAAVTGIFDVTTGRSVA